ncbi:hypothetical protein PMI14_00113 [Acidovorax sp. CF316]|uniref:hypothetical protein n=1 Tax=Acidovorax sp. CF316 TaxID=1144317 RepID=UPI00026BDA94|nr:hypothetical protein [Acidovorax sp. CF316]EJE54956.1 hypothetical protein PMI14_00113 [Acidovorax sp. CF316]
MIDFVDPSAPRTMAGADLPHLAGPSAARHDQHGEAEIHYWPCEVLDAFILQMAKRGHCVNTAMMLGHPPYAQEQLAIARQHRDSELDGLAARLGDYFSTGPASGSTHTLLRPWPLAS